MRTINYESDFKIIEGFKDGSSILAAPFRFTYYTKVSRGVYVAEYNGSEYVNCKPTEDGKVVVPFDSPKLGMGVLMVKREFFLSDSDFKDGICNLVSVESTGITLDKGATDGMGTIEVEIEPFYHIISLGDGEVTTQKIANGAVTSEKIAVKAVSSSNLADLSVTRNKIAIAAVTSDKIANNTVATNNLRDESVTEDKLSPSVKAMINKSGTTYRREYSVLDTANNGWYLLAEVGDDDMTLFQVSSKGHSDVLFSVATGWSDSTNGSLVILNSFTNGYNDNYAHVRGVRIRKQDGVAKVEIELKGPIVNTSGYVGIYATVFSNSNSNPLKDSLRQVVNVDQATIVQSYTLKDKAFMAENVVAKNVEADNIIENIVLNGKTYPAAKTIDLGNIQGGGSVADIESMTKITYAELKTLRDNAQLTAGHLYRITDYEFTTKQSNTKSAGNVFDIIVLATAENQLSELACAIQHEGDTYFDGNDLGAWELWYDLDNDTTKYEWADTTNGKGVIYRMIDEKRNDCPYDFKNALFHNTTLTYPTTIDRYYYTFSYVVNGVLYDGTVEKQVKLCYNNSMGAYLKINNNGKKSLNLNVFRNILFGDYCNNNTFGSNCYYNTFEYSCNNNTFGDYCYSNKFGNYCYSNTFEYSCSNNTFEYSCYSNKFGNYCQNNKFGNYCQNNKFGNYCQNNKFVNYCNNNTFGSNCYYTTFGEYCNNNTFGDYCYYNTFGDSCRYNTFRSGVCERVVNNTKNTSITINDEYYDDGSGQLVPIKHPDLSTQPSILPYKFMGQYVYEQLIPTTMANSGSNAVLNIKLPSSFVDKGKIYLDIKVMLTYNNGLMSVVPIRYYNFIYNYVCIDGTNYKDLPYGSPIYLYIVYTSMPEEGGDYYGYNNY